MAPDRPRGGKQPREVIEELSEANRHPARPVRFRGMADSHYGRYHQPLTKVAVGSWLGMIVIIDYGMGNLRSVQKAIEHIGHEAQIVSDPEKVRAGSKVILPGVGAFADAAAELKRTGL